MIKRRGLFGAALLCLLVVGMSVVSVRPAAALQLPAPVLMADAAQDCTHAFLGLEPWYNFMEKSLKADCSIKDGCFNILEQTKKNPCGYEHSDVPGILLAIIDDLLRISGLVAIGFVFAGAFKYIESRGNAEKTAQAQSTIINALAGLGIAMVAVGFITFLGSRLGG